MLTVYQSSYSVLCLCMCIQFSIYSWPQTRLRQEKECDCHKIYVLPTESQYILLVHSSHFFTFDLTGAFSQNVSKLFSQLKLVSLCRSKHRSD